MELIFRSIFWIGIASLVASLFIDFSIFTSYFVLCFFGGILLVVYSLTEQYFMKKTQTPFIPAQAQPVQQQQPAAIANRLIPLKEILSPPVQLKPHVSFFTRFFHHQPRPSAKPLPIASLANVKTLFTEDLHLQRQQRAPGTFQRPATQQPVAFSRPSPPAAQKQQSQLPFEEGLEHYVPTGADQLPHDHHNRYEEERETMSQPSDTRYQQASQQRLSPQQPLHHLSLLHYLHYKDKKHEKILFTVLLCLSLILLAISLVIPFTEYLAFVVSLLFLSLILLSSSVAELIHSHRHSLDIPVIQPTSITQPTQQPSIAKTLLPQQQKTTAQTPARQIQQASPSSQQSAEQLSTLIAYVQQSVKQHYPLDAIRAAAKQSGWPDTLVEHAILSIQGSSGKKKKVIILVGLVSVLLVFLLVLNNSDMFLVPYWFQLLGDASPQFYFIMIGVFLLVIILFVNKVRKTYSAKKIHYRIEEEQHIAEIKHELERSPTTIVRGTYETDFDRLYRLVSEKQKLTITEVAQGFNVSRKEAEEWGKILKEQGLIELHYPTVGDLELLWKK